MLLDATEHTELDLSILVVDRVAHVKSEVVVDNEGLSRHVASGYTDADAIVLGSKDNGKPDVHHSMQGNGADGALA